MDAVEQSGYRFDEGLCRKLKLIMGVKIWFKLFVLCLLVIVYFLGEFLIMILLVVDCLPVVTVVKVKQRTGVRICVLHGILRNCDSYFKQRHCGTFPCSICKFPSSGGFNVKSKYKIQRDKCNLVDPDSKSVKPKHTKRNKCNLVVENVYKKSTKVYA